VSVVERIRQRLDGLIETILQVCAQRLGREHDHLGQWFLLGYLTMSVLARNLMRERVFISLAVLRE
jgi:hypothetical protein